MSTQLVQSSESNIYVMSNAKETLYILNKGDFALVYMRSCSYQCYHVRQYLFMRQSQLVLRCGERQVRRGGRHAVLVPHHWV